jgi:hypothetical protein
MSEDASLELLNIFEIEDPDEGPRFLICFLEAALAGSKGIDGRAVVGDFTPKADGDFDPATFRLNPEFVAAFAEYINSQALDSEELLEQARQNPDANLFLMDPRYLGEGEPPPGDLLGWFQIDEQGRPIPGSFHYNDRHVMFDPDRGPSGILIDRSFYDWLHPMPR